LSLRHFRRSLDGVIVASGLLVKEWEALRMKRLTLAIALVALAVTSIPASAGTARAGSSVTVAHRRPYRSWHRPWYRGLGWGWGYWSSPYWYGPGYGPYSRGYYGYAPSGSWAAVDTDVSPESARVYLDGTYVGTADDFDGYPDYLYLRRGRYRLEFRLEGYQPRSIEVDARPGVKIDVGDRLAKIPGAAQYGSYDTPEPRGGVRRFWAKRRDVAVEVNDEAEIYGDGRRYRRAPRDSRDADRYAEDPDRDRDETQERELPEEPRPRYEWRDRSSAEERSDTRLQIEVEPSDAAIYLDDRFIGTASELDSQSGFAVAPGRHTVTVSRPGYRDRRVEVEVSRGETEKIEIKLER
jgi:hypothetical protein